MGLYAAETQLENEGGLTLQYHKWNKAHNYNYLALWRHTIIYHEINPQKFYNTTIKEKKI